MASQGRALDDATIRRIQILRKTLSLRQIARRLELSVPTVVKYLEQQSKENSPTTEKTS